MCFVERAMERGTAMAGGSERNPLRRNRGIRLLHKIRCGQPWNIDQHRRGDVFPRERIDSAGHRTLLGCRAKRALSANVPAMVREYTLLRESRCCARQDHFTYPLSGEFTWSNNEPVSR